MGGEGRLHATISVDGSVTTIPLPASGELTIGRTSSCGLAIPHGSVSRHHATLRLSPLSIVDVGSRNGTQVNGQPIANNVPTSLAVGASIQIGQAAILIHASS